MIVPDYVREFIAKIAIDAGYSQSANIEFARNANIGGGNLSNIIGVAVRESSSSSTPALRLVCKIRPIGAANIDEQRSIDVFKRETFVYEQLFPAFERFQRSHGLDEANGFFAYPKCHGCLCDETNDRFVIVMDDLRAMNYRLHAKREPIDLAHAQSVIGQLARFHAVSLAFQDQQPDVFGRISDLVDLYGTQMATVEFHHLIERSMKRALAVWTDSHPQHVACFRTIFDAVLESEELDLTTDDTFAAIVHGDCWNNNVLFRCHDGAHHVSLDLFSHIHTI